MIPCPRLPIDHHPPLAPGQVALQKSPEHRSEDSEGEGVISLHLDIPGELPYTLDRRHGNEPQIACILGTSVRQLVYSVRDGIRERVAVDCLRPSPRNEEWRPRPVFRARTVSRGASRVLACTSTSRGTGIEAPAFPRRKGTLCASLGSTSRPRPTSSPS